MGTTGAQAGFFEKRDLLFAEQPAASALSAAGRGLLEAGLPDSALELFVKAGDTAGVTEVMGAARAAGDAFTFEAALKALGKKAQAAEWVEVGETALAAGRLWFAYRAFEKADFQEGLERTRREMHAVGISFSEGH